MRTHIVNENFFSEPDILNSYWAGFIAADGTISKNYTVLKIALQEQDKYHLERFRDDLKADYEVKPYKVTFRPETSKPQWSLSVCRQCITRDLARVFNVIPNKSLILCPPNLEMSDYVWSYTIGLLDGDGSMRYPRSSLDNVKIIWNGTEAVLLWIKKHVDKLLPYYSRCKSEHPNVRPCGSIHRYQVGGTRGKELYDFLKSFDVPKLKRKWKL